MEITMSVGGCFIGYIRLQPVHGTVCAAGKLAKISVNITSTVTEDSTHAEVKTEEFVSRINLPLTKAL